MNEQQTKYDIAFNIVVKYGFCSDCRLCGNVKECHKRDCYDNVKLLREAVEFANKYAK